MVTAGGENQAPLSVSAAVSPQVSYPSIASNSPSIVPDIVNFLNDSWTAFHATAEAKRLLLDAGFEQLQEASSWHLKPGGKYFFTRNMSTIVAFAIGAKYTVGAGVNCIAAHTDSPCLKLKPVSAASRAGYLTVAVQTYGGGLWHTWFDRDLSVAGRVLLRRNKAERPALEHRLVRVDRPIMRVPTLAIHLDRTVNSDGFKPNTETQLVPLLATAIKGQLAGKASTGAGGGGGGGDKEEGGASGGVKQDVGTALQYHHPALIKILADELGCAPEDIIDFELNVCDTQPSAIGGVASEFIFSGRLDNLASSYTALRALLDTCKEEGGGLGEETGVRMVALFDHEEVGSDSAQGAGSPALFQAMKRLVACMEKEQGDQEGEEGALERTLRHSFIVSADMAHAIHPNYPEKHEERHAPKIHGGLVVKTNANQRYATNLVSSFLFKEIARKNGIPTQDFVVRNDMGCGSTIGPILASGVGIRTVDVGMPQLSMHSIREMCGTDDIDIAYKHFRAFFTDFASVDCQLVVD